MKYYFRVDHHGLESFGETTGDLSNGDIQIDEESYQLLRACDGFIDDGIENLTALKERIVRVFELRYK